MLKYRALLVCSTLFALSRASVFAWPFHGAIGPVSDSFANGAYVPLKTYVSPDLTTSNVLMSGFVRGSGVPSFGFSNSCGGSPCMAATITGATSKTQYFDLKSTAAGLALAPTGGFPPDTTITVTDSLGTYVKHVEFNALATSTDIAIPGGNVLPATQAQSGGRWVLNSGAFLKPYTPTPPTTSGDPVLSNTTFSSYVRCAGDPNNFGFQSNQAYAASVSPAMLAGAPFFVAGFLKPEDHTTFGMPVGMGNQTDKQFFLGGLTLDGATPPSPYVFEWNGPGSFIIVGAAPKIFNSSASAAVIGQWQFTAFIVGAANAASIVTDGVSQAGTNAWLTPTVNSFNPILATTFCSYEVGGGDAHNFNGGMRNWLWVDGVTPSTGDLNTFRSNPTLAQAQSLWGAGNIKGFWQFTANPQLGQTEPDLSGNGHDLTYHDYGTAPGHALPYLVQNEVPWLQDGSGLFEIDAVSGTSYQIKTTAGVSSLPAKYGAYDVFIVDKYGHEFPTTFYITDGL